MAEFCKCGSLILNGSCSKKGCAFASQGKEDVGTSIKAKKVRSSAKSTTKSSNPRKSSKCITYNLYDINEEENSNSRG